MGTLLISIIFAMCVNEIVKTRGWRLRGHHANPTSNL